METEVCYGHKNKQKQSWRGKNKTTTTATDLNKQTAAVETAAVGETFPIKNGQTLMCFVSVA